MSGRPAVPPPAARSSTATVAAALATATAQLAGAGLDEPRREARLLLEWAMEADRSAILAHPERPLAPAEEARFAELLARRAAREPASRLLGMREFWSLPFRLSGETLIPRPESETLIEAALALCPERLAPLRLLDLGTGTGCLLLALLGERPAACGIGVDLSAGASRIAAANAAALGLGGRAGFVVGFWGEALAGRFDVILANPPYISSEAIATLMPEVAEHEPRLALDGGPDGLAAYRSLTADLPRLLAPGGVALLEVGFGQAAAAAEIMWRGGLAVEEIRRDLAGTERCLVLRHG